MRLKSWVPRRLLWRKIILNALLSNNSHPIALRLKLEGYLNPDETIVVDALNLWSALAVYFPSGFYEPFQSCTVIAANGHNIVLGVNTREGWQCSVPKPGYYIHINRNPSLQLFSDTRRLNLAADWNFTETQTHQAQAHLVTESQQGEPKAEPSNLLFPTIKPVAPTVGLITAPLKKTAKSVAKLATPKSATRPLSSSSARPSAPKPKSVGSRPASIDPARSAISHLSSPAEDPVAVETKPDDSERQNSPKLEKPEPSLVALHTALPPSSSRPPTPPGPSPPKPSVPNNDVDNDDVSAAHWATEYDHIIANTVDASLRERLRGFGRDHLAKRAEAKSTDITTFTPFISSEPVFLASSQPTSLVRVKEIKPPPNQHTPTYGILTTGPIAQGYQYALLGTSTKYFRLVPVPLDACLDARVMCIEGRFVRCGCWPNDVVRPLICEGKDQEPEARFRLFVLRPLELVEEIVLGWEWAVEHVVHKLVRDEKLGSPSQDKDVLSDPDTKRLWGILDLTWGPSLPNLDT